MGTTRADNCCGTIPVTGVLTHAGSMNWGAVRRCFLRTAFFLMRIFIDYHRVTYVTSIAIALCYN